MNTPVVLFACVHNGGRSLAGRVLTEHYSAGAVDARSAGSEPGDALDPAVVAVLQERGLSTEGEHPKLLTFESVREADVVITMGCGEACPAPGPGKRLEDWELEDPKGKDLDTVRRIVDDIDARVRTLLDELAVPVTAHAHPAAVPSPVDEPEPPPLRREDVDAIVRWLDRSAVWLRQDMAVAASHGHPPQPQVEANLRLREDAALLFREAYDGR